MWQGLAEVLDQFAREQQLVAADSPRLRVRDLPPTLAAIVSVEAAEAQYRDTMRHTLGDPTIARFVRQLLIEQAPAQLTAQSDDIGR